MFMALIEISQKKDMKALRERISMVRLSVNNTTDDITKDCICREIQKLELEYHEKMKEYYVSYEQHARLS